MEILFVALVGAIGVIVLQDIEKTFPDEDKNKDDSSRPANYRRVKNI